jgi:hypothetical protein
MKKFSSIESFDAVYKKIRWQYETHHPGMPLPTMTFVGSVKLHGCNGGIHRDAKGAYSAQSRARVLSVGDDHYGMAAWLAEIPTWELDNLFGHFAGQGEITLFGEWIGKGIQSGCAVNDLPTKQFVVISAFDHDTEQYYSTPEFIQMPQHNMYNVLKAGKIFIEIDMENPSGADEELTRVTLDVERQCPYGSQFDCDGIGEGLVWKWVGNLCDAELWFKTKGDKHSNRKQKTVAPIDHELVESVNACVDLFLGDVRLNQGIDYLKEMNHPMDMQSLGQYLKWVGSDCKKEEMSIIQANGFEWKDVSKAVTKKAKDFFIEQVRAF